MKKTALITENNQNFPILIVDKDGLIGGQLVRKIKEDAQVIFVTKEEPEHAEDLVYIPFAQKFPVIPNNIYSHIFIIDDNSLALKEALPSFIKKAKEDNSVLVFAVGGEFASEKLVSDITTFYKNGKIAIFGDVMAKNVSAHLESMASNFLQSVEETGKINILGDGTSIIYPVHIEDIVNGILESGFSSDRNKVFCIFSKHGITELSFAHEIQKTNPNIKIDFLTDSKERANFFIPENGKYLLSDKYPIGKKVQEFIVNNNQTNVLSKVIKNKKAKKQRKSSWLIIVSFLMIFLLLILPLVSTLLFSFIGLESLRNVKRSLGRGEMQEAQNAAVFSRTSLSLAQKTIKPLALEANLLGTGSLVNNLEDNISQAKLLTDAAEYLLKAATQFSDVVYGKSANPEQDFRRGAGSLRNTIVIFQKDKAQKNILSKIAPNSEPLVNFISSTIDLWPEFFGLNGKRTYLILFQNNMELRPSGGFIGSYGLLTFNKGKITDFTIHDVYDADGKLKGHIEPPFPIRRYLPSAHWYLRDSNFDLSFSKSAAKAAYFLNLETGERVDGVVGVDVSFVKKILEAIGPVNVVDYKEKVTAENLFEKTETHVEKNFFPGSTQKKDFLSALFSSLQTKFVKNKNLQYLPIAEAVISSISEKHILFAFSNQNLQNLFTVNGWSSAVSDQRVNSPTEVNDFIGINETNLGVNKANYFLERSLSQKQIISENGEISGNLQINYKNNSTSSSWPGGDYKNYLRIILPFGATLSKIEFDGKEQEITAAITDYLVYERKNFIAPKGLEVDKTEFEGKNVYGFLVLVPNSSSKEIKISYKLLQKAGIDFPDFFYSLRVFKQPGTEIYPYDFSIEYPESLKLVDLPLGFVQNKNNAQFSKNLTKDEQINLKFARQ